MATKGIRSKKRAAALAKMPVSTRLGYFLAYGTTRQICLPRTSALSLISSGDILSLLAFAACALVM